MIGDRYALSKLIGEGGMADVYLAVDTILKRQVAIKVLRGKLNEDPVNIKRFQREANAITNLSHPNIVEVYDVGEDHDRNYFVMEYVPRKTLKQLVKARGALNPDEAINIMKQLVSATAHAHKNGVIHRDIKSQNVLIKDDGTVKLSDFGIAQTNDSQQLTQTDTVMGSVHYLAPELAKGEAATCQSDIYALGIVFYEMLTGDVPFHGDTAVEIAIKHMHDEIPSVKSFNPDLPQSVENIIIKATAKNKEDRYGSAEEMYDDLVTCLDFSRTKEPKLVIKEKKEAVKVEEKPAAKQVKRKKKRINHGLILFGLLAIAISAALVFLIATLNGGGGTVNLVTIPDVTGYSLEDATLILESNGFTINNIEREATSDTEKNIVLGMSPEGGSQVEANTSVTLYVSNGIYYVIDNYVGQNINSVQGVLESNGFTVTISYIQSTDQEAGTIISQSLDEGTVVNPDETRKITLTVAEAVTFQIPASIIGLDVIEAKETVEELGGVVTLSQLSAEENIDVETGEYLYETGIVISCSPDYNTFYTQTTGNSITLYYY